jgi:uncharacterized protein
MISDALAALGYLRTRKEINLEAIGFWGSSEGGMLATQVAARSKDVAFVTNFFGFGSACMADSALSGRSSHASSWELRERN